MSGNQQRGRGRGRGAEGGGRGARGGSRGGRGDSQAARGDSPARGGRGDFQGGRGDGQGRGGRGGGRGDRGGYGGPGQQQQMAYRGPPPGSGSGGIYLQGENVPTPDASITELENELVTVTRGRSFPLGDNGATVPGRRGYGTRGRPIILRTNYFTLKTAYELKQDDMEQVWYRYDVDVSPDLSKQKKRRLFDKILTHPKFNNIDWASDYAKLIVTTEKLDLGNGQWVEKIVLPPADPQPQTAAQGDVPDFVREAQNRNRVQFRVTNTGALSPRSLIDYLRSNAPGATYADTADIIQLFNVIMCRPPNAAANVTAASRNRFYPHEGHPGVERYELGGGLQALRGYYSSVRPAVGRLLLNLNVVSGAFYMPVPLNDLIGAFGGRSNDQREAFLRLLKVRAVYQKDGESKPFMTKTKSIVGFAKPSGPVRVKRFGNAEEVKFRYVDSNVPNAQPREVTVAEYFKRHHGITLRMPKLPVLNVGTRADPQYLPVELCRVVPGQAYNRLLGGDQTSEMLKFAARAPNLNAMSICGTAQSPGNGVRLFKLRSPGQPDIQDTSVKPWGFEVAVNMLTVPGRILSTPQVKYGTKSESPRNGAWNCANQKFFKPGRFGKWQALVINREGPRGNALTQPGGPEAIFATLEKYLKDYGITMGQRLGTQTILLQALVEQNRAANNTKVDTALDSAKRQGVTMLLVILPEVDRWLYARIKYYADIRYGLHTINSVGQKIQKENGQGMYMGNLALKFNIKGGGVNHAVPNIFVKPLDNKTMLMGIDVTHPSPGSTEGAPSIACVVASTDEYLTQWPGSVRTQTGRQEMVEGLREMVLERLRLWRNKHNGSLPTKIILYRDGVSEGQYYQVLLKELPAFEEAYTTLYGNHQNWPKMAIIIVGKRHHTRFYPTKEQDADYNPQRQKGSWNPLPGTIVDRHITGRIIREFYLQAHQGLQGTARPAHYVVIKDDISFEADELETFTHNLCYLVNRATKAVSICPPAYYADLLCERGRAYLFSTLAEDHGTDSSVYDAGASEWTSGVHPNLAESTWYV